MLVRARRFVVMGVMALSAVAISLPVISAAATSPVVTVLSPLTAGLRAPVKMAIDAAGNMYVADQRIGGVVKYDAYGSQMAVVRTAAAPAGVALAQDGTLLVSQSSFVARYDVASGQEIGRMSGAPLQSAAGIAVDDVTGYIYVADDAAGNVLVYNASGAFVQVFASGLLSPSGVAFEKISRQIVVAETFGNKVKFFGLDGVLGKSVGNAVSTTLGAAVGVMQFAAPVAVAFEYSKDQTQLLRMYVVDAFQNNIQVVDPATSAAITVSGTVKNYIGASGVANGQLMVPSDAVFDSVNGRLLVVNGFGNVTIYGIDGGKNPQAVDTVPPVFTINSMSADVVVDSVMISGTVEAGSTVQVQAGGSAVAGTVVYSGTSWSVQVGGLLPGANSITVSAKDAAGNSAAAQVVNVNYLLPAPALAISPLAAVTKNSVVTLSGTVDVGAVVTVTNQATSVSGNAVVSGSAWSYDVLLADGVNTVKVTAQKAQSAVSASSVAVTLDAVSPVLNVSALQNGSYTSAAVQNISGTVADASAVTVTVNGSAVALAGNAFSVPVALVNGSNLVSVVAVDAAGNTTTNSRTLYFDATRPNIVVAEPVDNSFTSAAVVKVSGSVDKVSAVTVAGVAATVQDNVWTAAVNLVAGVNTVEVVATDLYGNSSSVKRSITLDASNPNLSVATPAQDIAVNVPNILVSGSVSDSSALTLEYAANGAVASVPSVSAGEYAFNVDFTSEGTYPIVVTAKDAAGNTTSVVRNVIYDITPPVFTMNKVAGVMPTKLSGTVEAGASVVVKDGTTQVGTVSIANGTWNADLAGVNYTPENLLAVATDAAGNSTSQNLSFSFPTGSLSSDGKPTVQDALRSIRIVVNQLTPTAQELASYDIGPLVNGKPNPNGKIEIVDAILILRKALGLKSW